MLIEEIERLQFSLSLTKNKSLLRFKRGVKVGGVYLSSETASFPAAKYVGLRKEK